MREIKERRPMSRIERIYLDRIFSMTDAERMKRSFGMFDWMTAVLRHQIRLAEPGLQGRELDIRVAERLYASEPETLQTAGPRETTRVNVA